MNCINNWLKWAIERTIDWKDLVINWLNNWLKLWTERVYKSEKLFLIKLPILFFDLLARLINWSSDNLIDLTQFSVRSFHHFNHQQRTDRSFELNFQINSVTSSRKYRSPIIKRNRLQITITSIHIPTTTILSHVTIYTQQFIAIFQLQIRLPLSPLPTSYAKPYRTYLVE